MSTYDHLSVSDAILLCYVHLSTYIICLDSLLDHTLHERQAGVYRMPPEVSPSCTSPLFPFVSKAASLPPTASDRPDISLLLLSFSLFFLPFDALFQLRTRATDTLFQVMPIDYASCIHPINSSPGSVPSDLSGKSTQEIYPCKSLLADVRRA